MVAASPPVKHRCAVQSRPQDLTSSQYMELYTTLCELEEQASLHT
jgi:hypothetical protein